MQNGWDDFFATGRIEAYLSYKEDMPYTAGYEGTQENSRIGDNPYAGVPNHNGNGNESSAYRGI